VALASNGRLALRDQAPMLQNTMKVGGRRQACDRPTSATSQRSDWRFMTPVVDREQRPRRAVDDVVVPMRSGRFEIRPAITLGYPAGLPARRAAAASRASPAYLSLYSGWILAQGESITWSSTSAWNTWLVKPGLVKVRDRG